MARMHQTRDSKCWCGAPLRPDDTPTAPIVHAAAAYFAGFLPPPHAHSPVWPHLMSALMNFVIAEALFTWRATPHPPARDENYLACV